MHDSACLSAGEMDKLALEEAGLLNVVSVPDGAPRQVKEGELPPQVRSKQLGVPAPVAGRAL